MLSDPDQDCAVKCEAAHALKGASDMIGLAGLRALCFAIEMACRENRLADVADEFARLPDKVAEACRVLTDRMSVSPRRAR